jgi:hypothetical protein
MNDGPPLTRSTPIEMTAVAIQSIAENPPECSRQRGSQARRAHIR